MYQSMKIAILLVMLASSAVASASSCARRAQLAKALAQQRDTGVTFEQQIKSFDQVGLSDNDKAAAYQFSMAVYKDLPNKTPDSLATLVKTAHKHRKSAGTGQTLSVR